MSHNLNFITETADAEELRPRLLPTRHVTTLSPSGSEPATDTGESFVFVPWRLG